MKRGIAIASLLLASSSMTGCGDEDTKSGGAGPTEASASESITDGPTASGDGPGLELHDAGAEPRRLLRLEVEEGASEHATMTMTLGMDITLDGARQPSQPTPPTTIGILAEVTDVASNGDVTGRIAYDELDVIGDGPVAEQMKSALKPLEGVEGTVQMKSTGELIDSEMDVPDGLDPILSSTLDSFESQLANLSPPLPEEPVGVGASWTARTTTTINGIEAEAVYEYTVAELSEDSIVLDMSYESTAGEQDVEAPGLPAGSTLHLESMETSGAGRMTMEAGRLFPVASDVEGGGTVRMTAEGDGPDMAMIQKLDIAVEVRAD